MIPDDRPVLGKDLEVVRQQLGLLSSDMCFLLGVSMTRWMHICRRDADLPLNDPTMALLIRILDAHPELSILPTFPEPAEMLELLNKVQQVDGKKAFPVMLGSDASAGYRWLQNGGKQGPAVSRLMLCLKLALQAKAPENRGEVLDNWRDVVNKEAVTRGSWREKVKQEAIESGYLPKEVGNEANPNNSLDIFKSGKWDTRDFVDMKKFKSQKTVGSTLPKPKKGARKKEPKPA